MILNTVIHDIDRVMAAKTLHPSMTPLSQPDRLQILSYFNSKKMNILQGHSSGWKYIINKFPPG